MTEENEVSENETELCSCGYEPDTFACKIRHVQINSGVAKAANDFKMNGLNI